MDTIGSIRSLGICTLKRNGDLVIEKEKYAVEDVWECPIKLEKGVTWGSFMKYVDKNKTSIDFLTKSIFKKDTPSKVVEEWKLLQAVQEKPNISKIVVSNSIFSKSFNKQLSVYEHDLHVDACDSDGVLLGNSISMVSPALLTDIPLELKKTMTYNDIAYTVHTELRSFTIALLHDITYYGLGLEREHQRISFEWIIKKIRINQIE